MADFKGEPPKGIPAWTISVYDGTGEWNTGSGDRSATFVSSIPAAFRSRVALFWGDAGWVLVPRGWQLKRAVTGADGDGGMTFVAPDGASHGWLTIGFAPADMSSILGGAEGFFPGAHSRFDAFFHVRTPAVALEPKPDSLTHPNRCTAILEYRSGDLRVKGMRLWQPMQLYHSRPPHDPYSTGINLALPVQDAGFQGYLIAVFQKTRPAWEHFCPNKGW
ncbi:MAG: DUF4850 domain-containing protein [Rhodanobacteraceae bacterium]